MKKFKKSSKKVCQVTQKKSSKRRFHRYSGIPKKEGGIGLNHLVSGIHKSGKKKRFRVNLTRKKRIWDEKRKCFRRICVSTKGLRTIAKNNGKIPQPK